MTLVALTQWFDEEIDVHNLKLFLYLETDATNAIANGSGTSLTPGNEGSFIANVTQSLSGVYNVVVKQAGTVVAAGGKVDFDGSPTVFVDMQITFDPTVIIDAIEESGVSLSTENITAIALAVFRRLSSGSAAVGQLVGPTQGEPLDAINSADFNYTASIETAATSTIVFSIRQCADESTPHLEADSVSGLTVLSGVNSPTSSSAVITRVSGTQATVFIKAAALAVLAPGSYITELRELTSDGKVVSKLELPIVVRRSASRRIA